MPTKLQQARDLLAKRLEELEEERGQLTAAIAQLDEAANGSGTGAATPKRRSGRRRATAKTTTRGTRRKRAPRGERESQLLASIEANPGYRVSEHAREVGVKPQQLYPILNRLTSEDKITKKDDRFVLKTA
jgi:hypothetical protein